MSEMMTYFLEAMSFGAGMMAPCWVFYLVGKRMGVAR